MAAKRNILPCCHFGFRSWQLGGASVLADISTARLAAPCSADDVAAWVAMLATWDAAGACIWQWKWPPKSRCYTARFASGTKIPSLWHPRVTPVAARMLRALQVNVARGKGRGYFQTRTVSPLVHIYTEAFWPACCWYRTIPTKVFNGNKV
jgi:hypothetical protein